MTAPDLDALARELVEAGMPWLPGILLDGSVLDRAVEGPRPAYGNGWGPPELERPDLTDWPTIGALLGELSRRRPSWEIHLCRQEEGWRVTGGPGSIEWHNYGWWPTPGEAVGRALLAVLREVPRG